MPTMHDLRSHPVEVIRNQLGVASSRRDQRAFDRNHTYNPEATRRSLQRTLVQFRFHPRDTTGTLVRDFLHHRPTLDLCAQARATHRRRADTQPQVGGLAKLAATGSMLLRGACFSANNSTRNFRPNAKHQRPDAAAEGRRGRSAGCDSSAGSTGWSLGKTVPTQVFVASTCGYDTVECHADSWAYIATRRYPVARCTYPAMPPTALWMNRQPPSSS